MEKIQMLTFAKDNVVINNNSPGNRLCLIKSGSTRVVVDFGGILIAVDVILRLVLKWE